jgi:F0F1-type ATP synthase delta subunit
MEDLNLSEFFTTKAESTEFSVKLDQIMASIFETKFDLEQVLGQYFSISQKDKFLKFLRVNKIDTKKPTELKQFFEKIKEAVAGMKIIHLKLAFEPSEKTLMNFSTWFTMNVKKQFLFEIIVDRKLVAGAEINFNGKYLDLTMKKTLDQIFNPQDPAQQPHTIKGPQNLPEHHLANNHPQILANQEGSSFTSKQETAGTIAKQETGGLIAKQETEGLIAKQETERIIPKPM